MQLVLPFLSPRAAPVIDAPPGDVASVVDESPGDVAPGGDEPPRTETHPLPQIEFVRVRRARRYILRVRPDGSLRVTLPWRGSRREAQRFVEKQSRWIERQRVRVGSSHASSIWAHGGQILLRGDAVTIAVEERPRGWVVTYGDRRVTASGPDGVRAAIESDLRVVARCELEPRLRELATLHGLDVSAVSIRNQRSRWGSCASSGNIALNFRLVQMPPEVRDYVLVHELMHIRQQNHSRRFWKLVAAACPGFRDAERWLRATGRGLF